MEEKFEFNYSAPTKAERMEIESIKSNYSPEENTKTDLEKLRSLNRAVNFPPKLLAYIIGIVGILVFGTGMTMTLEWSLYLYGSIVGAVGVAIMVANYFIYKAFFSHQKKRYANEILALSDKLLNNGK